MHSSSYFSAYLLGDSPRTRDFVASSRLGCSDISEAKQCRIYGVSWLLLCRVTNGTFNMYDKKTLRKVVDKYTCHMYNKFVKKTWHQTNGRNGELKMNREEILAKAQKETDERELVIKNTAYKHASEVMAVILAALALFFVVDGFLLENVRDFSSAVIGAIMVGVYCIYGAVYEGYVAYHLKSKMGIVGCILMLVVASVMFTLFLSNIL